MADNFRTWVFTALLIGLCVVAAITFATKFASDNNLNQSISNDPIIANFSNTISNSINTSQQTAEQQREAFQSESPIAQFGSLVFQTITGVATTFFKIPIAVYFAISAFAQDYIGIPAIFFNVILAITLILLVLLAWRTFRIGD